MREEREEFIEALYAQYAPKLERMGLNVIHDQMEYRDIVDESIQKTFLKAFEEYEKIKDYEYIEAWLFKTCRYRLMTELNTTRRRQKRCSAIEENRIPEEQLMTAVDALPSQISDRELLKRVFDVLNEREKKLVQEHFVEGVPLDEIAQRENATGGAVRAVLARLRKKIRERIKDG